MIKHTQILLEKMLMIKLGLSIHEVDCRHPSFIDDEDIPHDAAENVNIQEESEHHLNDFQLSFELRSCVHL